MPASVTFPRTEDHHIPMSQNAAKSVEIKNLNRRTTEKHIALIKLAASDGATMNVSIQTQLPYAGQLVFRTVQIKLEAAEIEELLQLKDYEARLAQFIEAEKAEAKKTDEEVLGNYIRAIYGEMPAPEDKDGYDGSEVPSACAKDEDEYDDWGLYDWGGAPCQ